jgi:hypothetical protein
MTDWITIPQRLARLAKDPEIGVFGASGNSGHFFLSKRHTSGEVERLEQKLGVRLPEDYRQFLLEVGSGAGPYYGLFSPAQILDWIECPLEEGIGRPDAALPFGFGRFDAEEIRKRPVDKTVEPALKMKWPCNGCIPICHHGCTFWSVLVTAGECEGSVWDVACYVSEDGLWQPAKRPPGILQRSDLPCPPTFFQWYEGWLENIEVRFLPEHIAGRVVSGSFYSFVRRVFSRIHSSR